MTTCYVVQGFQVLPMPQWEVEGSIPGTREDPCPNVTKMMVSSESDVITSMTSHGCSSLGALIPYNFCSRISVLPPQSCQCDDITSQWCHYISNVPRCQIILGAGLPPTSQVFGGKEASHKIRGSPAPGHGQANIILTEGILHVQRY